MEYFAAFSDINPIQNQCSIIKIDGVKIENGIQAKNICENQ